MANPSMYPKELPLEQQAILAKCFHPSGTFVEFPKEEVEQSIPERFEKIVRMYPDRIAVKTENHVLTYAELNATANRVARAILAQLGSVLEPVGLLFEKDAPLMAAMLGVLKAGKFFVLLDLSFPRARIAAILEDSQAGLVVTDRQNVSLAREATTDRSGAMEFESIDSVISAEDLRLSISPNALAYISFTSGSTGQPKGVVQNHRNLLHRVMLYIDKYQVCATDRLSLLPSGTSNAVTHSFTALLTGAALFPFDVQKEGVVQLPTWLIHKKISFCWISAPLFRTLAATLTGREGFPDLRLIQLTSDTVCKGDVNLYKKYFPSTCLLCVGLSSSETGLLRIFFVDHKIGTSGNEVPVGYPVEDKEISLLDSEGKEIGFNEAGEIVVRSRYLSPGYWRRPDLTEAKFKPDPQGGEERLYFTGDMGQILPDGCLIHKGRKDFRVKIRGYGVETAEVEKVLRNHSAIKEAVVVAREDELGEARLVAYFTLCGQLGPSVSELRRFLKSQLADYMIPSAFVVLHKIPLTPNGKVDRRALPNPDNLRPNLDARFVAPRTPTEAKLARISTEVLGVDQVGIHDNFFDLGGHSLAATRLISRVIEELQVEIPLPSLFAAPTIAQMAAVIEDYQGKLTTGTPAQLLSRTEKRTLAPLSFGQRRLWFLNQLEPESPAYNEASAHRMRGALNVAALQKALSEIVARHEVLRTTIASIDGEPAQVISDPHEVDLPVIDLCADDATRREEKALDLIVKTCRRPFDLSRDYPWRFLLLRLAEQDHILLRVEHHIASDGWSGTIFRREIAALYSAFSKGQTSPLPDLPIQYQDYVDWQRRRLRGEMLETQLAYWRTQLDGITPLQLPTDRSRPVVQTYNGAKRSAVVPKDLADRLSAFSRQQGVTLFMTLLAAFQALLHRYTSHEDIVIGTPIAGRNRAELENLIGFFVNTLVLRTDFSGNPTFEELLERVRATTLDAYAHQDLSFEKLVEELQPERTLGSSPLFQVTFRFQNLAKDTFVLPGLTVTPVEIDSGIAKFDLALAVREEANGLRAVLEYNSDLFDVARIERMLGHYQTLLEGIVTNPAQRISDLELLTPAERHRLLVEWNDTQTAYPRDKCLHQLFEVQAEKTPDSIAVRFEDRQLTYRELNSRANQLAHYLQKQGVGAETLVGICLTRSLEMIVGLLGVQKAGGAYVLLIPTIPRSASLSYRRTQKLTSF
jgi:amino acid adenylation domain-containing protein